MMTTWLDGLSDIKDIAHAFESQPDRKRAMAEFLDREFRRGQERAFFPSEQIQEKYEDAQFNLRVTNQVFRHHANLEDELTEQGIIAHIKGLIAGFRSLGAADRPPLPGRRPWFTEDASEQELADIFRSWCEDGEQRSVAFSEVTDWSYRRGRRWAGLMDIPGAELQEYYDEAASIQMGQIDHVQAWREDELDQEIYQEIEIARLDGILDALADRGVPNAWWPEGPCPWQKIRVQTASNADPRDLLDKLRQHTATRT